MYSMKNGILYENGRPVFCVGLSYYPSYHERKVPVPEDGDRVGEMKKDLRRMKEAGFNLVRAASIGDVKRVNGELEIHTEFIERLLDEADRVDIASMMRLQGYSMNLSGYDDFYMINSKGEEMDKTRWYDFLQNSMYHPGILRDNDDGTRALAALYAKHPNLVSFQTYNEPHYPSSGVFDYHPATIASYRRWLVDRGLMSEELARSYEPPRARPGKDEDISPWVNWRLFSIETLSGFLNHSADVAKAVDPGKESLTCLTTDPTLVSNASRCVSYFDNAKGMDTVGITHYINTCGAPYFHACLVLDNAESAAAAQGKHCWLIEYDARTDIPLKKLYEETYMAVGAGLKGIMYYQWRGDYVFPDSPEGNGFGFINYDGTPTEHYEEKLDMVRLLNKLSDYIVGAEKARCGAAVLYSKHAFCAADALDNGENTERNRFLDQYKAIYQALRMEGITVDLVESDLLRENALGVRALYVPEYPLLSEEEKADLEAFRAQGGRVFLCEGASLACRELGVVYDSYHSCGTVADTLALCDIRPVVSVSDHALMAQVISGQGYHLVCLNNISIARPVIAGAHLNLNGLSASEATLCTPRGAQALRVAQGRIDLPDVREGGFLLLR